jgi:DNA-binding transcriptional MocR family regulator
MSNLSCEGVALLLAAPAAVGLCYLGHLRAAARSAKKQRAPLCVPQRNPGAFVLERFFAEFEFSAAHQICNSDVSSLSMRELLDMCSGDEASIQRWETLSLGYTESRGDPSLLEEIASCYGSSIGAADVLECVPAEGILLSSQALVEAGDEIVVVWPAYQSLFEIAKARGARVLKWTARGGGDAPLHFDVDDLAALCGVVSEGVTGARSTKKIKAIVINFPHNPTGDHITADEQLRIVAIARACGAFVLSDEMYRGLEYARIRRP